MKKDLEIIVCKYVPIPLCELILVFLDTYQKIELHLKLVKRISFSTKMILFFFFSI